MEGRCDDCAFAGFVLGKIVALTLTQCKPRFAAAFEPPSTFLRAKVCADPEIHAEKRSDGPSPRQIAAGLEWQTEKY